MQLLFPCIYLTLQLATSHVFQRNFLVIRSVAYAHSLPLALLIPSVSLSPGVPPSNMPRFRIEPFYVLPLCFSSWTFTLLA